jgi:aryl-alcohol dehydrogenase-like predicted oxidoreductase
MMEYRNLGNSGLKVSVLCFGTATFGGTNGFEGWGSTQVAEANRLINLCLDEGVNLFDTADIYSQGDSEKVLGKAIEGIRHKLLISTKATFPMGKDVNAYGSSRFHLIEACENSLKRLNTDHIDVYHMHGFDGSTPVEETLRALDDLVASGKVRYIACSNFSGWHLMKSLSIAEKYGWSKYISHQVYYSLLNREFEWELMPLGIDQKIGTMVWSPLASGRLSGKYRRNSAIPEKSRIAAGTSTVPKDAAPEERLYAIVDVLDEISRETDKSVAQIALNWLLQRPTVSSIIVGARTEEQLKQNLGASGWSLTNEQVSRLDKASVTPKIYPYWHQDERPELLSQLKF